MIAKLGGSGTSRSGAGADASRGLVHRVANRTAQRQRAEDDGNADNHEDQCIFGSGSAGFVTNEKIDEVTHVKIPKFCMPHTWLSFDFGSGIYFRLAPIPQEELVPPLQIRVEFSHQVSFL